MIPETRQLLSRAADSVYWMARYIERAENVARFIGVNLHLQLDLPLGSANQWQPLIDTSGDAEVFRQRYGKANQSSVIKFLA
ncbi:MAG: alpha-E domain-containing protein, partial [Candidatus Acidiferrales bacterium]